MKNEFANYEQSLALKELGFDEPCFGYYYTINGRDWKFAEKIEYLRLDDEINIGPNFNILAPLKQQVFRWFRKKYNLIAVISTTPIFDKMYGSKYKSDIFYQFQPFKWVDGKYQINNTYEEAENACIDKLIEIVKQK